MTKSKYNYQQVLDASLTYFGGDEFAAKLFPDKYALTAEDGVYDELTPDDMHWRLASEFHRIESNYANPLSKQAIYDLLKDFRYVVPQGSPMAGIGNPYQIMSISNCFVLNSPLDSYAGIMQTDQEQAHIMRRRGGVGFDLSNIRPKGLPTKNAAKTTDGIGIFMERYSATCREVAQNGRRGALMLTISIHHPEILTFIKIKQNKKKVTGANVSVRVSDEFMQAVKDDQEYEQRWPVDSSDPLVSKKVRAREVWDQLIECAHASAEPGILFWSTAEKYSPADIYKDFGFRSTSTNPCGEIILSPDDSCRLLLVNLMGFVKHPFTDKASFDYKKYGEVVVQAQRLMDDIIDLETECVDRILAKIHADPEPANIKRLEVELWERIKKACLSGRRTGLGITALGDALAALGIRYGSDESIRVTEEIYKGLAVNAYRSTCILAGERGAFPIFDHALEKDHPFLQRIWDAAPEVYELYKKNGRRNIALTTTAPAGSVSTLTQTTSGIEPPYLLSYVRRKKINPNDKNARTDFVDAMGDSWQEFTVYHPGVKQWMDVTGETDISKSPYYGATSNEIDWVASAKLQGAAQKWICHSISKTCNLPADTTVDVVKDVYMMAWEQGCKGFTVYRDGCRSGVLVSEDQHKKQQARDPMIRPTDVEIMMAPKRPVELPCDIKKAKVQGEGWTIFVGMLNGRPYEVFGGLSKYVDIPNKYKHGRIVKNGKVDGVTSYNLVVGQDDDEMVIKNIASVFENANYGAFTRTISLALRHGCPPQFVMEQLQKDKFSDMTSFSRVMGRVLKSYITDGTKSASDKVCPTCQKDAIIYQEGCLKCVNCGYSKCG
jgi:ribonucleoside-diphosphate reductase alpha chain